MATCRCGLCKRFGGGDQMLSPEERERRRKFREQQESVRLSGRTAQSGQTKEKESEHEGKTS